jgi:hypothetical protein
MSYLEDPDTDSDAELVCSLSEEEIFEIRGQCDQIKIEGNEFFKTQNYEGAIERYSVSLGPCFPFFLTTPLPISLKGNFKSVKNFKSSS